jgi:hypothetical protein
MGKMISKQQLVLTTSKVLKLVKDKKLREKVVIFGPVESLYIEFLLKVFLLMAITLLSCLLRSLMNSHNIPRI